MLIPSSDPVLEGRQLIISVTAGPIPALKVSPSSMPVTADREVREMGTGARTPHAHFYEQTDMLQRSGLCKTVCTKTV